MIEYITFKNNTYALVIRHEYSSQGIEFFTPPEFSQQVGYMRRQKGYQIQPHSHVRVSREVSFTNEVLFVKSGEVRVDFYDSNETYFGSKKISQGDLILLISGGHGFAFLEDSELLEVKQGPFVGDIDKKRFSASLSEPICWI